MPLLQKSKTTTNTNNSTVATKTAPTGSTSLLTSFMNCVAPLKSCCAADVANAVTAVAQVRQNIETGAQQIRANLPQDIAALEAHLKEVGTNMKIDLVPVLNDINKFAAELDILVKGLVQLLAQLQVLIPVPQVQAGITTALLALQVIDYALQGEETLNKYILQSVVNAKTQPGTVTTTDVTTLINDAKGILPKIADAIQAAQTLRIVSPSVNADSITNTVTQALNEATIANDVVAASIQAADATQAALAAQTQQPASVVVTAAPTQTILPKLVASASQRESDKGGPELETLTPPTPTLTNTPPFAI